MNKMYLALFVLMFSGPAMAGDALKPKYKKTQEVKFEGSEVDGVARTPDGAYVVHKRGVQFIPLYDLNSHIKDSVDSSVDYLK